MEKLPSNYLELFVWCVNSSFRAIENHQIILKLIPNFKQIFMVTKLSQNIFPKNLGRNILELVDPAKLDSLIARCRDYISKKEQIMLSYCGLKGLLTFEEYMQEIPRLKEELQMRDTESDKTA